MTLSCGSRPSPGGNVHSPLPDDVVRAARLAQRCRRAYWDSMVITSASRLECGILWSEDLNPGQTIDGVTVHNPFTE